MDSVDSEKEQLDRAKRWIQENGLSLVMGIVLGLGSVYAWRGWGEYQVRASQDASAELTMLTGKLEAGEYEPVIQDAPSFVTEQGGNIYADMGRLLLARAYIEQSKFEDATEVLLQVMERGDSSVFSAIAAQRLARVYLQLEKYDEATEVLMTKVPSTYSASIHELHGDIAYAREDNAAALKAYREAMTMTTEENALLQMKLDDLAADTAE